MGKKGISELISAIILIGVAIMVAAVVSGWSTSFTSTQQDEISCVPRTNYIIESIRFNASGNNELTLKVTNKGDTLLYGFSSVLENATSAVSFLPGEINQGGISSDNPLGKGESAYIRISLSDKPWLWNKVTMVRLNNQPCPQVPIAAPVTP